MGGKVVSVTTDGFITDVENLEAKMSNALKKSVLMNEYQGIRAELSGERAGLELKSSGVGVIA